MENRLAALYSTTGPSFQAGQFNQKLVEWASLSFPFLASKLALELCRNLAKTTSFGCLARFDIRRSDFKLRIMSKLESIEAEIRSLPREKAEELQDWLSEYLEDQAELNPAFIESIERGKADLKAGRVRVEKP